MKPAAPHPRQTSCGERIVPLSFQQAQMLRTLEKFPSCSRHYDQIMLFRLGEAVDLAVMGEALDDLIHRHPALRVSIKRSESGLVQQINAVCPGTAVARRVSGNGDDLPGQLETSCVGIDEVVNGVPLFRPAIYTSPQAAFLSLNIHHLISDEQSFYVLERDLAELYLARVEHRAPQLPAVVQDYGDFARRQRESWPDAAKAAVPFWRSELAGYDPHITWPGSARHEGVMPHDLHVHVFQVPIPALSSVSELSVQARVTPFMVLLAATAVAIARVTDRADLLVGTDTANRRDPAEQDMIGFMINTVMSRVSIEHGTRFADVVHRLRESWLNAYEYLDAYVDPVLQAIGAPQPLIVELTSVETAKMFNPQRHEWMTSMTVPRRPAHWRDLFVMWFQEAESFHAEIYYRPSRVSTDAVASLAAELNSVLSSLWGSV